MGQNGSEDEEESEIVDEDDTEGDSEEGEEQREDETTEGLSGPSFPQVPEASSQTRSNMGSNLIAKKKTFRKFLGFMGGVLQTAKYLYFAAGISWISAIIAGTRYSMHASLGFLIAIVLDVLEITLLGQIDKTNGLTREEYIELWVLRGVFFLEWILLFLALSAPDAGEIIARGEMNQIVILVAKRHWFHIASVVGIWIPLVTALIAFVLAAMPERMRQWDEDTNSEFGSWLRWGAGIAIAYVVIQLSMGRSLWPF